MHYSSVYRRIFINLLNNELNYQNIPLCFLISLRLIFKRFYIPCGLLVALIIFISLVYHFLQRPLELIFWGRYYYEKENEATKDVSKLLWSNEKNKKVFMEQNLN